MIKTNKTKLTYRDRITRDMLRLETDALFVFGDNMLGKGFGGQAKEMRGEPNAVGIPTKWEPHNRSCAFFSDEDLPNVIQSIDAAFERLSHHAGVIVWPKDNIGTGLANLPSRAPRIMAYINSRRAALEKGE